MPFPPLPDLILSDTVTVIRNTWGVGPGGLRAITASTNIGRFPAAVEPDASEIASEGFDAANERYTNANRYLVIFQSPDAPPDGLDPFDSLVWEDDAGAAHVLTVTQYAALGNRTGVTYASAIERT